MAEANLENILNSSSGEVAVFTDPHREIFFGPVTDKEREARAPLPRKTLHPCEIVEISKRGMTFHEWEDYKEQMNRNQLNSDAIEAIFGQDGEENSKDDDAMKRSCNNQEQDTSIDESFTSCGTFGDKSTQPLDGICLNNTLQSSANNSTEKDISGVSNMNDTWEEQERMLALAEKLERGEEIPELGIMRRVSTHEECQSRENKPLEIERSVEITNLVSIIQIRENFASDNENKENAQAFSSLENVSVNELSGRQEENLNEKSEQKAGSDERQTKSHSSPTPKIKATPVKGSSNIFQVPTPVRSLASSVLSGTPPNDMKKPKSTPVLPGGKKAANNSAPSPVGMYIRSFPEPMLIQNVHSAHKMKNVPIQKKPPSVAVKNKDGRWSVVKTPSRTSMNPSESNYTPVLPPVLHEAAATLITEDPTSTPIATPGTSGKIGKLLDRAPTPTVLKHQGRIKLSKDSAQSSRVVQSPLSKKAAGGHTDQQNFMEVSVLEKQTGAAKSNVHLGFPSRK